jgi:hypothetical protein
MFKIRIAMNLKSLPKAVPSNRSWPGDGSRKREESPDFIGHGALGNGGRGDPTESATETNRHEQSG